jgi:hypothetical protein
MGVEPLFADLRKSKQDGTVDNSHEKGLSETSYERNLSLSFLLFPLWSIGYP